MSKAYPSNLTHAQYEFLSEMIPEPKKGGRKREVDMWEVLNAIFYVLIYLPCHDSAHGEAISIKFDPSKLFKRPLI